MSLRTIQPARQSCCTTQGSWLRVQLKGLGTNRDGIGAHVRLLVGGVQLIREFGSGGSFPSQDDLRPHFGLGEGNRVDEIEVRWPSGRICVVRDASANRELLASELATVGCDSADSK